MPSGTSSGATTGAANMSKRKRANPKVGKKAKSASSFGHKMDRELNTPKPGGWANRTRCA